MNGQFANRRRFHRIRFDEQVELEFIDETYECCQIKNISLGGMFVTGCISQTGDKDCRVSLFQHSKKENLRLQASAKVVWENDEGVGLQFTSMSHDSYMLLLTTLINNAEQPVIIFHEFPKICPFEVTNA